mmetsp:Transcript_39014/g.95427  ORF Transcript_39014/g.95427 Transcript_39014/m.95427 type:complete len:94 (-) Transcript_39014:101-382(-)
MQVLNDLADDAGFGVRGEDEAEARTARAEGGVEGGQGFEEKMGAEDVAGRGWVAKDVKVEEREAMAVGEGDSVQEGGVVAEAESSSEPVNDRT